MHESRGDVLACTAFAICLVGVSLIPWLLLVNAEHLLPRWIRTAARSAAMALFLFCTPSNGATR
jgi:hypothetical protein